MLTKFIYFFKSGLKPIKKLGNDGESLFDGKIVYFSGYKDLPRPFNYHIVKIKRSAITQVHTSGNGLQKELRSLQTTNRVKMGIMTLFLE